MSTIEADAGVSVAEAAKLYRVSVRAVERARRILRDGIPELIALTQSGQLPLSVAERISCLPHEQQWQIVAGGPEAARRAVRQLAEPRPTTVGGAELVTLLDRALYDLEHGWPGAAADAIGRARALLVPGPA